MPHPIPAPRESGHTSTTEYPLYWAAYGDVNAPRLLILHGGPGADHEYLLPQMLHLAERYNCYFYDQRGGGKSRVESHVDVTWRTHVEDLARVAVELQINPLSIVGFSWGALLALLYSNYVRDNPGSGFPMPNRLVLINPAPLTREYKTRFDANMAARKGQPEAGAEKQRAFELAVAGYFARPEMARELTPFRVIGRVQQSVWSSLTGTDGGGGGGSYDIIKQLSPLGIPVLITHGGMDPIPVESSEQAAKALNSRFVLIPNSGHVPYVEEPEKLWAAVDPFLAETDTINTTKNQ